MTNINFQFLSYLAISSLAALVNAGVGFSLYGLLGLSSGPFYALSIGIGYLSGMGVNWSLNRALTFPKSGRTRLAEIRTFFVIALVGLLLTVSLAAAFRITIAPYLAQHLAHASGVQLSNEAMAQFIAIGLVGMYSFCSHKWLTFSRGIRFQFARLKSPFVPAYESILSNRDNVSANQSHEPPQGSF